MAYKCIVPKCKKKSIQEWDRLMIHYIRHHPQVTIKGKTPYDCMNNQDNPLLDTIIGFQKPLKESLGNARIKGGRVIRKTETAQYTTIGSNGAKND